MTDEIDRKDILNEVKDLRKDFANHLGVEDQHNRRVTDYKAAFDRHLEIYANNGKEAARLAANVSNLITEVKEMKGMITNNTGQTDGQQVDISAVKVDVDWLKRFFWVVITATVTSLVVTIFSIFRITGIIK